jgi:hypothetical protein
LAPQAARRPVKTGDHEIRRSKNSGTLLFASEEPPDDGYPMRFAATALGRSSCSTEGQKIRRNKTEDIQAMDLLTS